MGEREQRMERVEGKEWGFGRNVRKVVQKKEGSTKRGSRKKGSWKRRGRGLAV